MLSQEDNELVTRVGPATRMGTLMREYWVPALLSRELPHPDCDPVRVLLLGERLVAFRDSSGTIGLMPHACPHRGASLFYGRNEHGGLRCVYHGWKFGADGRCLDMPNEPPESNFKDKVRARAYPCVERAGAIWAYLGSRPIPPPLPHFEVFDGLPEQTVTQAYSVQCNWLQAMEGDHDPTHFAFLHAGHARPEDAVPGSNLWLQLVDRAPRYKVLDTPGGVMTGTYRPIPGTDEVAWHLRNFLMPFHTITGVGISADTSVAGLTAKRAGLLSRVPMDDEHTMTFQFTVGLDRVEDGAASADAAIPASEYTALPLRPNTPDWNGRFRWAADATNDYQIDRQEQRSGASFTGIDGVIIEDVMVTESMGAIYDRTQEHLGVSDTTTIRMRRRLIAAAAALAEHGTMPPAVDEPEAFLVLSGSVSLPREADWISAAEKLSGGWGLLPPLDPHNWAFEQEAVDS